MWVAWFLTAVGLISVILPALCLDPPFVAGPKRIQIIGAMLLIYSGMAMILGLFWLPSQQILQDVRNNSSHFQSATHSLSCDDISRAIPMLKTASKGSISVSDHGELEVIGQVWVELPAPQRNVIINLIEQHQECASGHRSQVVVRDIDGRNIISQ